jgi:hypothetical protein
VIVFLRYQIVYGLGSSVRPGLVFLGSSSSAGMKLGMKRMIFIYREENIMFEFLIRGKRDIFMI